jgi:N-acetylmuramoyl-L-alanine amidase
MRTLSLLAAFALACLWSAQAFAVTSVDNVRVYRAPDYTRFVFDVSEPAKYQVLPDLAPGRVVIDFREASLKAKLETVDLKDSPVRRVRSGQQADGTTRVVLDLAVAVRVNSFALPPNELYGHRLVVDLYDVTAEVQAPSADAPAVTPAPVIAAPVAPQPQPPAAPPAVAPVVPAVAPALPPQTPVAAAPVMPPKPPVAPEPPAVVRTPPAVMKPAVATAPVSLVQPRQVTVAIDPGHGGEDPGARGPKGTNEKDVVLAIARAVRDRMRDEPGMRAVLIRDGDYYVGLKERRTRARKKYDADLFVSIHADAFKRREARGASVFAVSRRGATSTLAAYLADSENRADLVGGIDPRTDNDLISVISDMMMEGTMRESLQLGRGVLDEIGGFARLHKHSVEQAGFMVLKEPNMPSILIETGFISNPEEERLLGTVAYQQRLAGAIVNGVRSYFERSPPPGTWFAARRDGHATAVAATASPQPSEEEAADADPLMQLAQAGDTSPAAAVKPEKKKPASKAVSAKAFVKHKVGKGQSLGWLANKYGVTQREIKDANNLRRDDIRIGETLKIPAPR